jgi:hypothetical protein
MNMMVAKGFGLNHEHQTFECLRCGRIEQPKKENVKRAA